MRGEWGELGVKADRRHIQHVLHMPRNGCTSENPNPRKHSGNQSEHRH